MIEVPQPHAQVSITLPGGQMTPEGQIMLQQMAEAIRELQAEVEAAKARIATLEDE